MFNPEPLFYWMNERHRIHLRRQAGDPWPWTKDRILQEYRFCNVFRELDTVTIWIRKNIREKLANHPNLWFWLCAARQINWPDTLNEIIVRMTRYPDWDPDSMLYIMRERQRSGDKVYTGAYMISGQGGGGLDKPYLTVMMTLEPLWQKAQREGIPFERPGCTIEEAVNWFDGIRGWGPFMAYEAVTDMRHTRYLHNAPDIYTWANPGPGARRGLNRIFGRLLDQHVRMEECLAEMRILLALANDNVDMEMLNSLPVLCRWTDKQLMADYLPTPLEMRDIEHSLCETDKYLRVLNGEGRPRAKYYPPAK